MATPCRGEVWLIDFGMAGKTRPALVVSGRLETKTAHSLPSFRTPPACAVRGGRKRYLERVKKLVLPISALRIFNELHC